jgi:hypothetical protein
MLEEVASCETKRWHYPWLLIAALFPPLAAAYPFPGMDWGGLLIVGLLISLVLVFVYLMTRQQVVLIASAGTKILLNTQTWSVSQVRVLIDKLETAKNDRYLTKFSE